MQASKNVNVKRELEMARERFKRANDDIKKMLGNDMKEPRKHRSGLIKVGEEEPKAQHWNSRFKQSAFNTRPGFKSEHKEDETKALQCNSHFEQTVCNTSAAFKRVHEEEPETQQRNLRVKQKCVDRIVRIKKEKLVLAKPTIICTVFNPRVNCEVKEEEERATMKRVVNHKTTVFNRWSGPPTHNDVEDDVYEDVDNVEEDPIPHTTSQLIKQNRLSKNHVPKAISDAQCTARNKRMFRALMGTLQKFQDEEDSLQEAKRAKIEKKFGIAELREQQLHQMNNSRLKDRLGHFKQKHSMTPRL